jgi:hypothetical protein
MSENIGNSEVESVDNGTRSRVGGLLATADEVKNPHELEGAQKEILLIGLEARFNGNPQLHKNVEWDRVKTALNADPEQLWKIWQLEATGGEPDVFMADEKGFVIGDCSAESPSGRRDVVLDKDAELALGKGNEAKGNAVDLADIWAVGLMDEKEYLFLQKLVEGMDMNTFSILKTPADVRAKGLALVGDRNITGAFVDRADALDHSEDKGFRCSVKVKWASN